jgi:hypothetical protein
LTPIKYLLLVDTSIFAVDHAGKMNPLCDAIDQNTAMLLLTMLRDFHNVPAKILDARSEVLLQVEA